MTGEYESMQGILKPYELHRSGLSRTAENGTCVRAALR